MDKLVLNPSLNDKIKGSLGDLGEAIEIPVGSIVDLARPYKVYTALLTQSGTDAPVAKVLENTIGNIWFTYGEVGTYYVNSNELFTENKTITSFLSNFPTSMAFNENLLVNFERQNVSQLTLSIVGDGYLGNTPIEIRVYN